MIGRRLDRYELLSSLGQGGMGSVWSARDTHLEREVALKIVAPHLMGSSDARARLLREAKTASKLEHPGIARVLDAGEADGDLYVVFELIEGSTLKDLCASGPVAIDDAVRWVREAAEALAYAHDHGILHRDVTSRNVMVDSSGRAVLVDFGLATTEEGSRWTQATAPLGTASYVAPEVARGERADRRSDVYSLSVVLYELLTGRPPFSGERLEAVLYAVVHEEATPPSTHRRDIPAWLDEVLAAGLAKNPEERLPSAEDLAQCLTVEVSAGARESERKRRVGRSSSGRSPSHNVRLLAVTIIGAALILLIVSALFVRRHTSESDSDLGLDRIAVVDLHANDEDPNAVGLAEGVWASLQSKLTRNSTLDVTPWETSRRVAAQDLGIVELAEALQRDALVVGQMLEAQGRLRGTVSILRGKDAAPLWSLEFDEPQSQVMELERRLATEVAEQLVGRLSDAQRQGLDRSIAENSEAFRLYLEGARALQSETREGARQALQLFLQALDEDPTFALAHVGLGALHAQRYWFNWEGGPENLAEARRRYERALELDPGLIEARRGLITVAWYLQQTQRCMQQGELVAATGRRDAEAVFVQAVAYMFGGLVSRAIPLFEKVLEIDPKHEGAAWFLVPALNWDRRPGESIEAGTRYLRVFGEDPEVRLHMGASYSDQGKLPVAIAYFEKARDLYGLSPNIEVLRALATHYEKAGDNRRFTESIDESRRFLESRLQAFGENIQLRHHLAFVCALGGDLECAESNLFEGMQFPDNGTVFLTLLRLGRADEARALARRMWSEGYFSETDFYLMLPDSPGYEPELGPLLPEAEILHRRLLDRYDFGMDLVSDGTTTF